MSGCIHHIERYVLPAAAEYEAAELALSAIFRRQGEAALAADEAFAVKRKAMDLAVAIDGMRERAADEFSRPKEDIHQEASALCAERQGCLDRIRAVAAAYRHSKLSDPRHPLASEDDILTVGAGYGIDGYGIGKRSGPEVLMVLKDASRWKFLGDAPYAVAAWIDFLRLHAGYAPTGPITVCGLQVA